MSIALVVDVVSGWRARVSLTLIGEPAGTRVTLWRDDLSGALVGVAGGADLAAGTVLDDTPALNRPTWYRGVVSDGRQVVAGPVTVTSTVPVLADPSAGDAVQVTVAQWPEIEITGRATPLVVDVADPDADPVVWLTAPEAQAVAQVTLRTDDGPTLRQVRAMMRPGRPLLLRGSQPGLEDPWLVITGRRERRVTSRVYDWARYHVLDVGLPRTPPDQTVPLHGDTLGDLAAVVPTTLGAIADRWATLGDIARADLAGMS